LEKARNKNKIKLWWRGKRTFFIKSSTKVKGVVREESFIVQSSGKKLCYGIARHGLAMVELIGNVVRV
jgi:hypothetical protein